MNRIFNKKFIKFTEKFITEYKKDKDNREELLRAEQEVLKLDPQYIIYFLDKIYSKGIYWFREGKIFSDKLAEFNNPRVSCSYLDKYFIRKTDESLQKHLDIILKSKSPSNNAIVIRIKITHGLDIDINPYKKVVVDSKDLASNFYLACLSEYLEPLEFEPYANVVMKSKNPASIPLKLYLLKKSKNIENKNKPLDQIVKEI